MGQCGWLPISLPKVSILLWDLWLQPSPSSFIYPVHNKEGSPAQQPPVLNVDVLEEKRVRVGGFFPACPKYPKTEVLPINLQSIFSVSWRRNGSVQEISPACPKYLNCCQNFGSSAINISSPVPTVQFAFSSGSQQRSVKIHQRLALVVLVLAK